MPKQSKNGERFIPVARPWMDNLEVEAVSRPILSGWVTQGPEVVAFEQEFAAYLGARHACAVSSCTTALHLALLAVGVSRGDEVITVSHSFIATANVIRYCGAIPVFVDIEPDNFNLNPALLDRVISKRTRAILCVHQMGMPCDLSAILQVARKHQLTVVEDAACAIGSEVLWHNRWERIGRPHGDIACFSFHPRKLLTTGDGGMLTTTNADWDKKFRLWRQHSMSIPDSVRHSSSQVIFESYPELGFNYRMTDIQASVGRAQLAKLPKILSKRREQVERYYVLLSGIAGLVLTKEPVWARSNWQSYCVRLPKHLEQKKVMQAMADSGIATRRGIMCAHREPAFQIEPWSCGAGPGICGCPLGVCDRLAESEIAQDHSILLPLFHQMTPEEQDLIVKVLREVCVC